MRTNKQLVDPRVRHTLARMMRAHSRSWYATIAQYGDRDASMRTLKYNITGAKLMAFFFEIEKAEQAAPWES